MPIFISLKCNNSNSTLAVRSGFDLLRFLQVLSRECIITGAAGARTRRSLGHHLLHPLMILRLLVLCAPADFGTQSSPGCTCTCRSKFLMHSLLSHLGKKNRKISCQGWNLNLGPADQKSVVLTINPWQLLEVFKPTI